MKRTGQVNKQVIYHVLVRGKLGSGWSKWFTGFTVTHTKDESVFEGEITDQTALFEFLIKIRNLSKIVRESNEYLKVSITERGGI
jgi:hypothetical protein